MDSQQNSSIVSPTILSLASERGSSGHYVDLPCFTPPGWCDCCPDKDSLTETPKEMSGVDQATDKENSAPSHDGLEMVPAKKKKLSLNKSTKKAATDCFELMMNDEALQEATKAFCPRNTLSSNKWALKIFSEWIEDRQKKMGVQQHSYQEILFTDNASELSQWLSAFVKETRKVDRSEHTPKTLYMLIDGLQREIRLHKHSDEEFNLFTDARFESFRNCCNHEFRRLHQKGVATSIHHTETLTEDDERKLWESGVLNVDTPIGLFNCVFFYNGKKFCLRGGDEHRNLKLSQLQREEVMVQQKSVVRYTYTEHGSKNRSGGMRQFHLNNKIVHQYQNLEVGCHDHVYILDKYFDKLPDSAKVDGYFYLRPLLKVPEDSKKPWFAHLPVGKNKLSSMVKEMCKTAGIDGNKTNHGLRSCGVTSLYKNNASEKLIQDRSGHRSLTALRVYERPTAEQMIETSKILAPPKENQPIQK